MNATTLTRKINATARARADHTSQQHLDALMAAAIDRYQHSPAHEAELAARKAQALRA